MDAAAFEHRDTSRDDFLFEFESWNGVDEESAGSGLRFENRDSVTELGEFIRARHAGRAGSNDCDAESVGRRDCDVLSMVREREFVNELFDRANGDGFRTGIQNTRAFTETFLRTDARTYFGHVARALRYRRGFGKRAFGGEGDPFGNTIMERATFDAQRLRAVKAAAGL